MQWKNCQTLLFFENAIVLLTTYLKIVNIFYEMALVNDFECLHFFS